MKILIASIIVGVAITSGCSGNRPVQTQVLLNHKNCQTLEAGVTEVSIERVAQIRGSRLLSLRPEGAPAATDTTTPKLSVATRVFAISKGNMPTPGYQFGGVTAQLQQQTLTVQLQWQTPEPNAVLPQMVTHPCLVLALPTDQATTLVVRADDTELGRLSLGSDE